jgi:hypothetical protein
MRRRVLIVVLLIAAGAAASLAWWLTHRKGTTSELALYGNVDLRQVSLPFNNKVGPRVAERGMLPLLQAGVERESLQEERLGQRLDALWAAHLHRVLSALARNALEGYSSTTAWRPQETPPLSLSGTYAGGAADSAGAAPETAAVGAPRPPFGPSKAPRPARTQVLRSGEEWRWGRAAAAGQPRGAYE